MSNVTVAINALSILIELAVQTQKVATIVQRAQMENRDVTEAELNEMQLEALTAADRLRKAVA